MAVMLSGLLFGISALYVLATSLLRKPLTRVPGIPLLQIFDFQQPILSHTIFFLIALAAFVIAFMGMFRQRTRTMAFGNKQTLIILSILSFMSLYSISWRIIADIGPTVFELLKALVKYIG